MIECGWLRNLRQIAVLSLVVFLTACAGLGERRDAPADISEATGEAVDPSTGRASRVDPAEADPVPAPESAPVAAAGVAHNTLMVAALQARSSGNSGRAVALLERAQRIDPDNGELYLELARTHFDAGNVAQGRATAERGLLYCRGEECAALRALLE
ncbi:MAG: tetratricopeptide repeat protein [Chromatocurvus sp.]